MKRFRMLGAVAAVVAMSACAAAEVEEPVMMAGTAADEAAIEAVVQSIAPAWNAMDVAAMTAMVTEDYQGVTAEGDHVMGRAAYEAQLTADFAEERPEGFSLSLMTEFTHWHSYDMATVGGTFMVAGLPEGAPNSGSWMVNVERTDGGWLMSNALVSQFVDPELLAMAAGGGGE